MRRPGEPDVLVIGAGVVGLCCAYFLRRSGCAVTVLERATVADPLACSSGNTGFVAHGGAPLTRPGELVRGPRPVADREALRWLWLLRRARSAAPAGRAVLTEMKHRSLAILRDLCAAGDLATTFAVSGMVVAFRTGPGFETASRSVPAAVAGGVATRVLTPGELRDLEPGVRFDIAGALYQENGGYLHAPGFVVALAAALRGMGVDIREHAAVLGFEVWRDRVVRVRTTDGDFEPGEAVLAAGTWSAWCARQLGVPVPLQPVKGYTVTLRRPRGTPRAPVLLSEDSVAVRPLGERLRLAGGVELSADRAVSGRRVAAILGAVHAYLPGLDLAGAREVWTGLRPCTPDSLPYLGRTARYANLTLACGHGHVGMGLAPIGGKLVAQLVVGDRPDMDVSPFETDRFTRGRG